MVGQAKARKTAGIILSLIK